MKIGGWERNEVKYEEKYSLELSLRKIQITELNWVLILEQNLQKVENNSKRHFIKYNQVRE